MNVEIGAEAALFPEKEYINGISVAEQKKSRNEKRKNPYELYVQYCTVLYMSSLMS